MTTLKLLVAGALVMGLGGCASQPTEVADKTAAAEKECLRDTGSRIKRKAGECNGERGDVYDREDLERSGATSVGEMVRRLGGGR